MIERPGFEIVANALIDAKCIQFGEFVLKDGSLSPVYLNLRMLRSFPKEKSVIVSFLADLIDGECRSKLLADVPTSATPLVSSISDRLMRPQITPRLDNKNYGSRALIDGEWEDGDNAVLIDDLITTAKSKFEAINVLESFEIPVRDVVVVIDREQGGREQLQSRGYQLRSLGTLRGLIYQAANRDLITLNQAELVNHYLDSQRK